MKIILEGPDCAGKTTLANLLKQKLTDYLYIHNGIYSKAYKPHIDCLKLDNVIKNIKLKLNVQLKNK